ncbi:hypothetical protein I4F81_006180 [Pyropia yezoensis]|uniref:Uncharacterized protein n=1 Tax=Pyropia yezoensis TaxID=2788 RepID=A0ACC3C009_PYRYE|nr:hypothetical protein I4F81_006180 [Neopyropia yezoensis]
MPGGLPLQFRHYTRTLEFGPEGSFFMSIGSRQTDGVDDGPWRSLVKRFSPAVVAGFGDGGEPFPWQRGQTWALGLRNEVGIRFDSAGVLWGVEIGQNLVVDADLGGDLTADNPSPTPPGGHTPLGGRCAFPASGDGDMLALSHGSFDRVPPVGYAVARVPVPSPGGDPDPSRLVNLFASGGADAKFESGARMVDGRFYADGSFVFSSDTSGGLIVLRYYR